MRKATLPIPLYHITNEDELMKNAKNRTHHLSFEPFATRHEWSYPLDALSLIILQPPRYLTHTLLHFKFEGIIEPRTSVLHTDTACGEDTLEGGGKHVIWCE